MATYKKQTKNALKKQRFTLREIKEKIS